MSRIARIVITGYPYHITQRGNNRQAAFIDRNDYLCYIKLLSKYGAEYQLALIAYCLMPNHVHLIVIPGKEDSFAKTFNVCHMLYSQYFNKKNNTTGHLWQGRFYSCLLGENHLLAAIRYVENNPLRAKLVKNAEDWEWSSATEHLYRRKGYLRLVNTGAFLEIGNWKEYLLQDNNEEMMAKIRINTLSGWPLGDTLFIQKLEKLYGKPLIPMPAGRPRKKNGSCP